MIRVLVLIFIGAIIVCSLGCAGVEPLISYIVPPDVTTDNEATNVKDNAVAALSNCDIDVEHYAELFNEYREEEGLRVLIFTDDPNKIAALRLEEIIKDFSHNSAGGYNKHLAENIVVLISNNQEALEAWKESYWHNVNILDSSYKNTGYAAGSGYAVQVFSSYETINGEPQLPPDWFWPD